MKFMFSQNYNDDARKTIVEGLDTLAKMSLNKQATENALTIKFSVSNEDYNALNATTKEKILKYSAEKAGIVEAANVFTKEGLALAMTNQTFEWNFFAIQTEVITGLLANTETTEMMRFIDMASVGLGDSKTWEIGTRALYDVEKTSYGSTVTRPRKHFAQPLTLVPVPHEASVQFDVVQMLTSNYDFGAEIAKIVLSVRAKQLQDAIDVIFNTANVSSTVFYKATFNKANYTELADRLEGVNDAPITSYGARRAFATMSDTITTGYTVQDELVKKSYIADLYGVASQIFPQSVDTSSASFTFRVPNDRVVMLSAGSKPVKMVTEEYVHVKLNDGDNNSIMNRVYKYIFSYTVGLVASDAYGIQVV